MSILFLSVLLMAIIGCGYSKTPQLRRVSFVSERHGKPLSFEDFTIASLNARGLRSLVTGDDSRARAISIGWLLNDYPLVLLQEDFAYHEEILKTTRHSAVFHSGKGRFGILGKLLALFCGDCGSGLTILLSTGKDIPFLGYGAESFGPNCSGWFGKRFDCWVPKGFQCLALAGIKGKVIIYNTHLDAGKRSSDRKARSAQLALLKKHIVKTAAMEDTIFLGGDFNAGHTELEDFSADLGLKATCNHSEDGIDHIFYRAGIHTEIVVLEAGEAKHIPDYLSDHRPIFARFRIE